MCSREPQIMFCHAGGWPPAMFFCSAASGGIYFCSSSSARCEAMAFDLHTHTHTLHSPRRNARSNTPKSNHLVMAVKRSAPFSASALVLSLVGYRTHNLPVTHVTHNVHARCDSINMKSSGKLIGCHQHNNGRMGMGGRMGGIRDRRRD